VLRVFATCRVGDGFLFRKPTLSTSRSERPAKSALAAARVVVTVPNAVILQ